MDNFGFYNLADDDLSFSDRKRYEKERKDEYLKAKLFALFGIPIGIILSIILALDYIKGIS
jgi:hypothetical protein